ncbi:MAG: PAS domain-containing protein [Nitrospina sp.]|nr:PAS domain-containing protein [Nitrospina sp.]MBT6716032.1 PAS domain-containing protein [Nitrospina sp.]
MAPENELKINSSAKSKWSVSKKLTTMNIIIIISGTIGIIGALQLAKGSSFQQLNFLHVKHNNQFFDDVLAFKNHDLKNLDILTQHVNNIRKQPKECLESAGWFDRLIMTALGTDRALALCRKDIVLADRILEDIQKYQNAEINHESFLLELNRAVRGFRQNSNDFEPLIATTVKSIFLIIFYMFCIKTCFVILGGYFINRSVSNDYQKLKSTEEALKRTLERHDLSLEVSKVGIWDWNLTTDELIWDNQMYSLYGMEKSNLNTTYDIWETSLHPEDKERRKDEISDALDGKKNFDTEFRVVWPNGQVKFIRAVALVHKNDNGKPIRMLGVNWDITEQKRLEEILKRSNDELNQFAYRTSHDLKAPLIRVDSLTHFIEEDLESGNLPEVKENVRRISNQVKKLSTLVGEILHLSQADVENKNYEEIDFNLLLKEIRENLDQIFAAENVDIIFEVSLSKPFLGEKMRIKQVLENLISNGVKYSNPERSNKYVKINVSNENQQIKIVISDNGLGIPKEFQGKIFSMFQRFHPGISFGSGLGMSFVKKHLDYMGGEISFKSSDLGTQFDILLPKNL